MTALLWLVVSFFARSPHYSMNVDMIDASHYNVTVVDLTTNKVVAQPQLDITAKEIATSESDVDDLHFRIMIHPRGAELTAQLEVAKAEEVVDSMRMMWTTSPHPRIVGGVIGGVLPPGVYRVGGDVKAPVVLHRVEPMYTDEARKARVSGIVIVQAIIDKSGNVRDVQVLKPLPFGLDQAAVDAVKQWKFAPATRNGEPVDVIFNLTVSFSVTGGHPQQ